MRSLKLLLALVVFSFINVFPQTVPVTLHYKPVINDFETLRLVGNFNGWNNNDPNMVMTDADGDGIYEITKELTKGVELMYKFVFDANWSLAWNDPDNPDIKLTDNNNSILNITDPYITYLLPRGVNSAGEMYVDTTITGEPIRAIFAFTAANPIDLTSLIVTIDGIALDNPAQYYIEEKKEFFYQPAVPLAEGEHTVEVSISSALGTVARTSTFKRIPGLVVYKAPVDFYYDEFNTGSTILQSINSVSLVGEFNNWNESFDEMDDNNNDGLWEVTTYLEQGEYEYKFKLNNSIWTEDPDEPNFSSINDNNIFTVAIDSIPSMKLLSPNESTTFLANPAEFSFEALLRPGVKSSVDESTINITVDGQSVPYNFTADTNLVSSDISLNGEGVHNITVSFTNTDGLTETKTFSYGVYTENTGIFYADAINDEPYSYPAGVDEGSCDIVSVLIDEVPTHDSLFFSIDMYKISDRTRLGLLITNQVSGSAPDPLELEILTEDWHNEGVFIPIGLPGNSFENTQKENRIWIGRDSVIISDELLGVNEDADLTNNFQFTISLEFLDSLLGSWTRERSIYLFSFLANDDLSGNGFEVTSLEGGSDDVEDPDIYDAAFFRSGFWQHRIFSNFIPVGGNMGPRTVSLNGFGRGRKSITASDISDSLATYGPAITFLTPSVTYWYPEVTVKGELSDPDIPTVTFSFNGVESSINVTDSKFDVPVILEEGENVIFVKATDNKGFESISKNLILTYEKDHNPVVSITGTIDGRTVNLSADAYSPDSLGFTYYWKDDDDVNPGNLFGAFVTKDIQFTIPTNDGEYYIDVWARDSQGRSVKARKLIFAKNDSVYFSELNDHASWIDSAVFYEIYPRSYSTAGNFDGIKNKIPDMVDLGINAVWFMPIYTGPTVHGYEITNYFGFEEDYGDAASFRSLVDALHNAGIKVILDFVVNHTSIQHPFMQNVLEFKANSPWADFYIWDGEPGNSNYEFFFDWASLPNLNHNNIEVRNYFIKAAKYWVAEYNIDGYRCDVAWGVEQRNQNFWQEWRLALKNIKPEIFLEAEASSSEPVYYQNRFDSANDWDLRNKIIGATNGTNAIDVLDAELRKTYPSYARPFRFVENHDEVRVASSHDTQRSKLMHTILFTANGIPLIYSGGEVGEQTNRGLIDWSDPDSIRPYFKSLINMRKKYLTNPELQRITTSLPADVYAYISTSGNNSILTVANFRNMNKSVSINVSELPGITKYLTDLINGSVLEIQQNTSVEIDLEGYQAKVFYLGEQPVSVESNDNADIIINEFSLSQNYPNPFNPVTTINYQVPKTILVTISVFDLLGREITKLVNEEKPKGKYSINLNGANLTSGIYFYRMKAGDFISTKKLILLK